MYSTFFSLKFHFTFGDEGAERWFGPSFDVGGNVVYIYIYVFLFVFLLDFVFLFSCWLFSLSLLYGRTFMYSLRAARCEATSLCPPFGIIFVYHLSFSPWMRVCQCAPAPVVVCYFV
jgi:hypothetical protein